jgi:hypothetical protein
MMKDSCDHYLVRINAIQNSMTAMNYAPDSVTIVRSFFAAQREVFQSCENPVYASLIGCGSLVTKPLRTKIVDFGQVCTSGFA